MNEHFIITSTSLEKLLKSEKEEYEINRKHFFFNVLEHCYKDVSVNEKMEMLHYFTIVEKTLTFCRNSSFSLAQYWINYLDNYKIDLPPIAKDGILSSYYPMVAYYYYAQKNYLKANETLIKCFPILDRILEAGVDDASLSIAEQRLNIIRLESSEGINEDTFSKINQLVKYIYLGENTSEFKGNIGILLNEDLNYKISCLRYYFDSAIKKVFSKIVAKEPNEAENLKLIFKDIKVSKSSPIYNLFPYEMAITSINNYIEGQYELFLKNFNLCIPDMQKLPVFFQILLLDRVKFLSTKFETPEKELIVRLVDTYYTDFLNLSNDTVSNQNKVSNNPLYFLKS